MPPMPNSRPRYISMYMQFTRDFPTRTERRQYMVLPPLPLTDAGRAHVGVPRPSHEKFLVFYRSQTSLEQRSIWRYGFFNEPAGIMSTHLRPMLAAGQWKASPIIKVETDLDGIRDVYREVRTPYKILNKVKRAALSVHGLEIT